MAKEKHEDFRDPQLRGIISIVAEKNGVNPAAVSRSLQRGSTKYLEDINTEVKKRLKIKSEFKQFMKQK